MILAPGPQSGKLGLPDIPIVSDNAASYEAAILMTYGERYRWAINRMIDIFNSAKLSERIASLPPGKVIDVSNIKEDGSGVRMIAIPGPRSKKFGIDDPAIPFVSNNFQAYETAILKTYGESYRWAIDLMYNIFHSAVPPSETLISPRASSPRASRPISPRASRPISPRASRPISPRASRPISPRASRPVSPRAYRPVSPLVLSPRASSPRVSRPISPRSFYY
jgi:hypothetical protein